MKNIIVGVTGSIAAYKAAELIRGLRQKGANVQVVMTEHAQSFITPLTLQALSGKPVLSHWSAAETQEGMDHIALARWADAIICAPASANFLSRLLQGAADDLLTTLCLATSATIFVAPAMNPHMWENPATQNNMAELQQRGIQILGPAAGEHACGEEGLGRMLEPQAIIEHIFSAAPLSLAGHRVLITAGPTQEAIDPVRYISNRSSGKMGFALAEAAYRAGAEVIVISGPVALELNPDIARVNVISAAQMHEEVLQQVAKATIFIAAAAVADYQVRDIASNKIKKTDTLSIELMRTPDILNAVSQLTRRPFIVGFALETENLHTHAEQKLQQKKLDMIVGNQTSEHTGFNTDTNAVIIIHADKQVEEVPLMSKTLLAQHLIARIAEQVSSR